MDDNTWTVVWCELGTYYYKSCGSIAEAFAFIHQLVAEGLL